MVSFPTLDILVVLNGKIPNLYGVREPWKARRFTKGAAEPGLTAGLVIVQFLLPTGVIWVEEDPSLLSTFLLTDECPVDGLSTVDDCEQSCCSLAAEIAIEQGDPNDEDMGSSSAELWVFHSHDGKQGLRY